MNTSPRLLSVDELRDKLEKERSEVLTAARKEAEAANFHITEHPVQFLSKRTSEMAVSFQYHWGQDALEAMGITYDDVMDRRFAAPGPLSVKDITDLEKITGRRIRDVTSQPLGTSFVDTGVDQDFMADFADK